jgi:hypothetical protein
LGDGISEDRHWRPTCCLMVDYGDEWTRYAGHLTSRITSIEECY